MHFVKFAVRILVYHTEGKVMCFADFSCWLTSGPEAQKHAQPMTAFVTTNISEADQVTKAEVKMSMLCAKNNVALKRKKNGKTGKTKATQLLKDKI